MNHHTIKMLAKIARENPKHHPALVRLADQLGERVVDKAKAMDSVDPQLAKWLANSGLEDGDRGDDVISAGKANYAATSLKPSQTTMVLPKAVGMALGQLKQGKVGGDLGAIISKDRHILDGHHRWAAAIIAAGPKAKVGGLGVNLAGADLLKVLNIASKGLFNVRNGKPGKGAISTFKAANTRKLLQEFVEKGMGGNYPLSADEVKDILESNFGSVEAGIEQMAANTDLVSKKVPDWAPDRKQMPVIDENKLPAAAKALNKGQINWQPPFGEVDARAATIRLAASLPKGSEERRVLLNMAVKVADEAAEKRERHNEETRKLMLGWIKGGIRDMDKWVGTLYLNDLSKAYNQVSDLEGVLNRMRSGLSDLEYDYIMRSDYGDFYDELQDSIYDLEQAVESVEHDLTQMIDKGWADDGYEDQVQEEIEEEILPGFENALDSFRREYRTIRKVKPRL